VSGQEIQGMARERTGHGGRTLRGFASMEQEKQREIARKGGANVPHDKRSFAQDRALASEAGRKGGRAVAPEHRSFAQNRSLAAAAGRKGGQTSQSRRHAKALGAGDTDVPAPDHMKFGSDRHS
jgi:general stress protein YciG